MQAFFRETGDGPGVVCLHANASTSGQWRGLMDTLSPRFHVLAADSYGAGASPPWPASGHTLRAEAELVEPVFARAGRPLFLVGHSYGGAIAMLAAALHPGRVAGIAVYEPTLFALVEAQWPPPNGIDRIRQVGVEAGRAAAAGDADAAARIFIDFWMGAGAWEATPAGRKPAIAQSVLNVGGWWRALAGDATPLSAFAAIEAPVLYLAGGRSPESAHAVRRVLAPALRNVRVNEFPQLGHMGPITHPWLINAEIAQFIEQVAQRPDPNPTGAWRLPGPAPSAPG